jgi:hypothetical protein
MGQKVNPHGLRVGVIKNWDSRWYESDEKFGDTLVSDYKIRKYLKEKLQGAGVPKFEIERDRNRVRVFIHCAKPGMVIGRGGAEIDKLKVELEALVGRPVLVNVVEIKTPDLNAQLVAESIAAQLEKRTSFRRAMKQAIGRTMRLDMLLYSDGTLFITENKYGTGAVSGKAGMAKHYSDICKVLKDSVLLEEMKDSVCHISSEKKALGLNDAEIKKEEIRNVEILFLLADYNPRSGRFSDEIKKMNGLIPASILMTSGNDTKIDLNKVKKLF